MPGGVHLDGELLLDLVGHLAQRGGHGRRRRALQRELDGAGAPVPVDCKPTLADGLAQGQASSGKYNVFASWTGGNFEVESRGTEAGFDSDNKTISVGITMRASDAVTVGAALGRRLRPATSSS